MKKKIRLASCYVSAWAAFIAVFLAFASAEDFIIRRLVISIPFCILAYLLNRNGYVFREK